MKNSSFAAPLAAAVLALSGCSSAPAAKPEGAAALPVPVAAARMRSFQGSTEVTGNLVAARAVTLGADAAGRLTSVAVRVGDHVAAGDVVAVVDGSAYAAAANQANGAYQAAAASVAVSQAQLDEAQTRYRLASVSAARMATLYRQGAISRQQFDESQAALQTARAGVDQARASLASASGAKAESSGAFAAARVPLANTVVRAPFGGVITAKMADAGAVVNPGAPIAALEDDRNLEAELAVPEALAASLAPGTAVTVHVDATGTSVPGRVRAVIPASDAQLHTATVRVSIAPGSGMLRGMFARIRLPQRPRTVVAVPWSAVITRAGQSGVFAIADGRARFIPVEPGATDAGAVEVRGVRDGTLVATGNLDRLTDGAAVSVR